MKRRVLKVVFMLLFIISNFALPIRLNAYTQPLNTKSGITYPISLSTGKDSKGKIVIPDKNFLAYLSKENFRGGEYQGRYFDMDNDGQLSEDECDLVRVLEINGRKDIASVEGIAAFPKLREFRCGNTGINKLDLSYNPRLQELSVYGNEIEELDVSGCSLLSSLDVHGSSLCSLNLSKNQRFEYLALDNQVRETGEYEENGKYVVDLQTLDSQIDIRKIYDVKMDGAEGDGIHSIYDAEKGRITCSDEIKQVTYKYDTGFGGSSLKEGSGVLDVTLNLALAYREAYDTKGGSRIPSQYIKHGEKDVEPVNPDKDGYEFTGWYTNENCEASSQWQFGQTLTGNLTLYAGWDKKFYKVHYDTAGGSSQKALAVREMDWWTTGLCLDEIPVKRGYTFAGWRTESGQVVTVSNNSAITYGQASGDSKKTETTLTAIWNEKKSYCLTYHTGFTDKRSTQVNNMPETGSGIAWNSNDFVDWDDEPDLKGYNFVGWYTARTGGIKVTEDTLYRDIYASQFAGDSADKIPVLYARFATKNFTIQYNTRGGSSVSNRKNIPWGSKNLLPTGKPKKRNYIFAGWRCNGKKVTRKTALNSLSDGNEDVIILNAVWYKKYEKKGKIFKRYGCKYKVIQSNKKGNKICLIGVTKKKVTIRRKVFYNGKFFTLKTIRKKALKGTKKVTLQVPKKQKKKYEKMVKRAL